jgi:hypothetical protein
MKNIDNSGFVTSQDFPVHINPLLMIGMNCPIPVITGLNIDMNRPLSVITELNIDMNRPVPVASELKDDLNCSVPVITELNIGMNRPGLLHSGFISDQVRQVHTFTRGTNIINDFDESIYIAKYFN